MLSDYGTSWPLPGNLYLCLPGLVRVHIEIIIIEIKDLQLETCLLNELV